MFARAPVRAGMLAATAIGAAAGWLTARHYLAAELAATRHAACHDPLTGVANRAGLTATAGRLIEAGHAAGRPVVVGLVDLVGFKQVNDTYGHDAGDAILTATAGRLTDAAGLSGMAARLGGDEFAIVAAGPASRWSDAQVWLSTWLTGLHTRLTTPVTYQGQALPVGATIGATLAYPDWPVGVWLTAADRAMYAARVRRTTTAIATSVTPPLATRPAVRVRSHARPTAHLADTRTITTAAA